LATRPPVAVRGTVRATNLGERAQHYKSLYTLRAAAMIRADLDPGLLDEISHWRNDDLWTWSLDALLVYLRVAAERTDRHSRPSANGSRPATRSPSNADPVRASG
jgi:hypothetical protein